MSKITDMLTELSEPIINEQGLELWDVEFVKEAGEWYLRLFLDSPQGVDLAMCEKVTRALNPLLDEREDMFPEGGYIFEVGSAGAERKLKRPSDFERFLGSRIEIKLYKQKYENRVHVGTLTGFDNGDVTLTTGEETLVFEKQEIAGARLRI